jgi:transposase
MRYVPALLETETKELLSLFKYHKSHSVRRRAHMIMLSAEGFPISEIARIYQVHRDTVLTTFGRWEKGGLDGLYDAPKSGRPPKLSKDEADKALKYLEEDPRSIKKALLATQEKTGQTISEWTLKRIAKKNNLRWKRMRKSVKGKRNKIAFQQAKEEIEALHAQEASGELDVRYFDETGFSLVPVVPYAWQRVGETIGIPDSRSKRLNVLAFWSKEQDFQATTVQGRVTSQTVIACFDKFSQTIKKKTVVIIDNASVHTSSQFKEKRDEWEKRGLSIKYLPTYSPELNLIEIVWRFIKYSWLPLTAYLSFKHLKKELRIVLDGIGSKYQITFA